MTDVALGIDCTCCDCGRARELPVRGCTRVLHDADGDTHAETRVPCACGSRRVVVRVDLDA